jgi:hypothetical protein
VDIRQFLPDLRTDSLFAIAPTITLSLRKLRGVDPVTSDFWTLARALKTEMDRKIDGLNSTVYDNFLGMEHMHDAYDRMTVYAQSKRAGQQVSLSYVGKLDLAQNYRDFCLQEICDISAMMEPTPANLIAIYSFAGQFHFSLASDESSLPYAQALQIKEQVTATLLACLTKVETPAAISAGASSARAEVS